MGNKTSKGGLNDAAGDLDVNLNTLISGEDQTVGVLKIEKRFTYNNITGDVTTVVKSGAGFLHSITFNKPIATEVVTIYDNTSAVAPIIGTITSPASPMPVTLFYDVSFSTGLTIVTATALGDITVSYR